MKLALLSLEISDDLKRKPGTEIATDEHGFQFIPINVGLGETLK
jgi:hypothetical protein